jgi:hypothetical protein
MDESARRAWVFPLALGLGGLAVTLLFARTIGFQFVTWDDQLYVFGNPGVRAFRPFSLAYWMTLSLGYPTSIPTLTYSINFALGGFAPAGYHAANVLLHALNFVLCAILLVRLGVARWPAILGALLFACHPIAAEPVAWVTGRKDLVATSLAIGALLAWLRDPPTRRGDFVGSALFVLAALSKPSVWALPLAVLVLRRVRGQPGWTRLLPAAALPFVIGVAIIRWHPGGIVDVSRQTDVLPFDTYRARLTEFPLRALRALGYRIELLGRPHLLRAEYLLDPPRWLEAATLLGLVTVIALGAVLASRRARASRAFPFALLCAAAILPPAANALHTMHEVGDSHAYLLLVPLAGLFGLALEWLGRGLLRPRLALALACAFPLAFAPIAYAQTGIWRDDIHFWSALASLYPMQPEFCLNLGSAYGAARRPREALAVYEDCAARQVNRRYFLHNMTVAARDARDQALFSALLSELIAKVPDDPLAKAGRARALAGH